MKQTRGVLHAVAGALPLILVLTGCAKPQTYGFVATLGNDTTSVEVVTRTGSYIIGDAVGRSPTVTRRHWQVKLGPDGTITSWSMDTKIPNAPDGHQNLHHTAKFDDKATSFTRDEGSGGKSFAYAKHYVETVPWNAFVYATWELLIDAARRHTDSATARIGQYFFEGWDQGHVGYADVVHRPDGSYEISSTGLAGSGIAQVDSSGRLASYSGQGTTYKQEVRRITEIPDLDAIQTRFAEDERKEGTARSLSPRDTVRAAIGSAQITIDYSRPARRGRVLVPDLIPYDQVWRTGANAATQLTTSGEIELAGVKLHLGTYTLWTLPTRQGVMLVINGQSGQWGTEYDSAKDIARKPMTVDSGPGNVERFTIRTEPPASGKGAGQLVMEWGNFKWSAPLLAGK